MSADLFEREVRRHMAPADARVLEETDVRDDLYPLVGWSAEHFDSLD